MRTTSFKALFIILCSIPVFCFGQRITVKEAAKSGLVKVEAVDNGTEQGDKEINISIKNLTGNSVDMLLESGLILDSVDSLVQDHIITQSHLIALQPFEKTSINTYGMCIEGEKAGPDKGDKYDIVFESREELTSLAKLVEKQNFQDRIGQNAIWALTNGASIASIYDENDPARSKALAEFVADMKGEEVPWYNVVYEEQTSDERMFTGDVARLDAVFRYSLLAESEITFGIYHPDGEPLQIYFEDRLRPKGNHRLKFSFEATGLAHGTYHVKLFSEGVLIENRSVEL